MDALVARRCLTREDVSPGKKQLQRIVSMLVRLIASLENRVAEGATEYDATPEFDYAPDPR